MKDIFLIFALLTERKINYCFQCQGKNTFYNLSVEDAIGRTHYFNSNNIEMIEKQLKLVWGHLLELVNMPTIPEKKMINIPRPF